MIPQNISFIITNLLCCPTVATGPRIFLLTFCDFSISDQTVAHIVTFFIVGVVFLIQMVSLTDGFFNLMCTHLSSVFTTFAPTQLCLKAINGGQNMNISQNVLVV